MDVATMADFAAPVSAPEVAAPPAQPAPQAEPPADSPAPVSLESESANFFELAPKRAGAVAEEPAPDATSPAPAAGGAPPVAGAPMVAEESLLEASGVDYAVLAKEQGLVAEGDTAPVSERDYVYRSSLKEVLAREYTWDNPALTPWEPVRNTELPETERLRAYIHNSLGEMDRQFPEETDRRMARYVEDDEEGGTRLNALGKQTLASGVVKAEAETKRVRQEIINAHHQAQQQHETFLGKLDEEMKKNETVKLGEADRLRLQNWWLQGGWQQTLGSLEDPAHLARVLPLLHPQSGAKVLGQLEKTAYDRGYQARIREAEKPGPL